MKKILLIFIMFLLCLVKVSASDLKTGDVVSYNDMDFVVVDSNNDYCTMIKDRPLTTDEVRKYLDSSLFKYVSTYEHPSSMEPIKYGNDSLALVPFYASSTCNNLDDETVTDGCKSSYDESLVKKVVDAWGDDVIAPNDKMKDKKGYYARLLEENDLVDYLGFELKNDVVTFKQYYPTTTPDYFINLDFGFWIMSNVDDSDYVFLYNNKSLQASDVYFKEMIKPIVTVKKDSVTLVSSSEAKKEVIKNLSEIENISYKKGEIINYKGVKYYVLKDSPISSSTLSLLKVQPLTAEEVKLYGGDDINKYAIKNDSYTTDDYIAYYSSETCINENISGCTKDYDKSEIKYIVDNWSKSNFTFSELGVDEYGYSARIITEDDLINYLDFKKEIGKNSTQPLSISPTNPDAFYNLDGCWATLDSNDSNYVVIVNNGAYFHYQAVMYKAGRVCPVVTLLKKDRSSNNNTVNSPDTYLKEPYISTIIGAIILFIVATISFVVYKKLYNYKKSDKI